MDGISEENKSRSLSCCIRSILDIHLESLNGEQEPPDISVMELSNMIQSECNLKCKELFNELKTKIYASFDIPLELKEPLFTYILKLFANESTYKVVFHQQLQGFFGLVSTASVERIFQICKNFYEACSQNTLDYIFQNNNVKNGEIWKSIYEPILLSDVICDQTKLDKLEEFVIHTANEEDLFNDFAKSNIFEKPSTSGINQKEKYNRYWFDEQFRSHETELTGLSTDDFFNTVFKMLEDKENHAELENDLVDMLGVESFDLIVSLLCNRDQILKDIKAEKNYLANGIHKPRNEIRNSAGVSYMQQVIVQSEQEKCLSKQIRKMEKKLEKSQTTSDIRNGESEILHSELNSARMKPVLRYNTEKPEKLPFVFNEEAIDYKTKSSKVLTIPLNAQRKLTEKYEEITIPAAKRDKLLTTNKKFPIKELDQIGQMVFQGVETLNHIQTVVFDVAYQTNENMLVCAPTGAGKTNIALLTITHQIKNYIEDDIIHRDQFKIVYICPMKALAAEMVRNFSKKLACLGIIVKELTGDMQLTRKEIVETQMLVTTPEKWDVITRKGTGDNELSNLVKLIIFDEVHLLNTERGPVIEALVARTLRQVISSQRMIRLVGLSATLPNYLDVAHFLRVNPYRGLYFFDSRFRSVPLEQTFIGVKSQRTIEQLEHMDEICFDKILELLQAGHQAMVFVHSRNMTVRTGLNLKQKATTSDHLDLFVPKDIAQIRLFHRELVNVKNKVHAELFQAGIGVHHAGMLRSDRNLVEKAFLNGTIRVIVCTATLAWGVNLPAHGVIIKGTQIYSAQKCGFVDLDVLDVLQIFGRAGRPQFDKSGHGYIITTHDKMHHYLSLLTNQCPIESKFLEYLVDNLNAEIVLGTVNNLVEAVEWLTFTYMYRRIRLNPLVYGISHGELQDDPTLRGKCLLFIKIAAEKLDKAHMIRYNERNGDLSSTHLGRIASYYYIKYDTIEIVNENMTNFMTVAELINMMALAQEFQQIQVRMEELDELYQLSKDYCYLPVPGGEGNVHGKVNILMQTYLSHGSLKTVSLVSDMEYIAQNVVRIARALFEMALHNGLPTLAGRCLTLTKMFEIRMWDFQTPMRQFTFLPFILLDKIETKNLKVEDLREYDSKSLGQLLSDHKTSQKVIKCAQYIPIVDIESSIQPITRGVLRIKVFLQPRFTWNNTYHIQVAETFWIWVEDPENETIYHWECFSVSKTTVAQENKIELVFTVALYEDHPAQYLVRVISDRWMGAEFTHALSFQNLVLPASYTPHTDLLELRPLQTTVLQNQQYEALYTFSHFNPIQTQIFHPLYHSDCNVLLGAPTGSGKTIAAELCMFRLFNTDPKRKVVYVAPLKALVRERVEDWKERFEKRLGKLVVEVTGDVTPSFEKLVTASIIITTPEKWDGISRSWQTRNYVKQVGLMIIDEIHLLGQDRGAVLEVIVSRTNFIASNTKKSMRIIGLSTAMANASDMATWLNIEPMGLFNFRPTVRPVPLEVHISGFPGKHYCPRMVSMNKPTFRAIMQYAPTSPALVFVSSRRQTRMTAMDLIAYIAVDMNPKQWLHEDPDVMESIIGCICDTTLKHSLAFGIGIHHGGLQERDRKVVEALFLSQKIQILLATATLAWGVNFPAHLVVIKGTEYFDSKVKRYVDMPITDVLQMMGRAGRPQFDNSGVACVFVHDVKKNFYKKFLYEPFPVESNLLPALPDHINAEIVAGNVTCKKKLVEYITWTYFFRRLLQNPTYYKLPNVEPVEVNDYLQQLADSVLEKLVVSNCVVIDQDENAYESTFLGQISSFYYLSHKTVDHFNKNMNANLSIMDLLKVMCDSEEYATFSVRHNEDQINCEFNKSVPYPLYDVDFESPHVKANLLLQAHFSQMPLPNPEYYVDLRSVMDQSLRILQAMIDIAANNGWLPCALRIQLLVQMIVQGEWCDCNPLNQIPGLEPEVYEQALTRASDEMAQLCPMRINTLPGLIYALRHAEKYLKMVFNQIFQNTKETDKILKHISSFPLVNVRLNFFGNDEKILVHPAKRDVITIRSNTDYNIEVELTRTGSEKLTVLCSRFSKNKDEGWFMILGNEYDDLLALKRICVKNHKVNRFNLNFTAPDFIGHYILTFYLMSDSYLGLDQQYDIYFKIISKVE